jgi:hypothetical protein
VIDDIRKQLLAVKDQAKEFRFVFTVDHAGETQELTLEAIPADALDYLAEIENSGGLLVGFGLSVKMPPGKIVDGRFTFDWSADPELWNYDEPEDVISKAIAEDLEDGEEWKLGTEGD